MTTHEEADVFPSNDVWIRRMIEADRVRRVFTRPRNRGA